MSTQHTPGPWVAGTNTDRGAAEGRVYILVNGSPWMAIAVANGAETIGQNEANARLIAAAPELLALVDEIEAEVTIHGKVSADEARELLPRLRAVLAKVRP